MRKMTKEQEYRRYVVINMPYEVLHVLIKNGVLTEYLDNIIANIATFGMDLKRLSPECSSNTIYWISWAFPFFCTKEGSAFWAYILDQVRLETFKPITNE